VKLEEARTVFMVATLGCALVVAFPALGMMVPSGDSTEKFSGLWLLGPNHMTDSYPSDVEGGKEYGIFVGVDNHMDDSEYYRIYVKLSNGTEFLPDTDAGVASSLSPLYEFRFFIADGALWESAVTFWFDNVVVEDDVLVVRDVTINGITVPVDASTVWNPEKQGYFFELFFELWSYDVESGMFRFDDQFVGLWLNMTSII
jgi:hypothetical protein